MGVVEVSFCRGYIQYKDPITNELAKIGCTGIECLLERFVKGILAQKGNSIKIAIISPYEGYPLTQLIMPIACISTHSVKGRILFISKKSNRLNEYKNFFYENGDPIYKTLRVSRYSQRKKFDSKASLLLASEIRKIVKIIPTLSIKLLIIDHIDSNNITSYAENKDKIKNFCTIHLIPSFLEKTFEEKLLEVDTLEADLVLFSQELISKLYDYRFVSYGTHNSLSHSLSRLKNVASDKRVQKKIICNEIDGETYYKPIFQFYEKLEDSRRFLGLERTFKRSYFSLKSSFNFLINQFMPLNETSDKKLQEFGRKNKIKIDKINRELLQTWNRKAYLAVDESNDSFVTDIFTDARRLLIQIRNILAEKHPKFTLLQEFLNSVSNKQDPPLIYIFCPKNFKVRYQLSLYKLFVLKPEYKKLVRLDLVTKDDFDVKPPGDYLILFGNPTWQDRRILESGIARIFVYLIFEFQSEAIDMTLDKIERRKMETIFSQKKSFNDIIEKIYKGKKDPLLDFLGNISRKTKVKRKIELEPYIITKDGVKKGDTEKDVYPVEIERFEQTILDDYTEDELKSLSEISEEISGTKTAQKVSIQFTNGETFQFPIHGRIAKKEKSGRFVLVEISDVVTGLFIAFIDPSFKHDLFLSFVRRNRAVYESLIGFKAWKEFLRKIPGDIDVSYVLKRMSTIDEKKPSIVTHYPIKNWIEQSSLGPRKREDLVLFIKVIEELCGFSLTGGISVRRVWSSLKAIRVLNQSIGRQMNRYLDRILIDVINNIPVNHITNDLGIDNNEVINHIREGVIDQIL